MSQNKRIYLDYQASTPTDPRVLKAMLPFFTEQYGNPHASEHIFGWDTNKAVENSRHILANAINADDNEVFFTSGATESNNIAILGAVKANNTERNKVLVSAIEHKCVLNAASSLQEHGYEIIHVPVNPEGIVEVDVLKSHLDEKVLIVSIMAVNNEIGTIEPLRELAEAAHEVGALLHTDAAQALTARALDVVADSVDILSLSSHKVYGPMGIGALYIRREVQELIQPLFYGGGQENGLRPGTLPAPLCVGFGKAVELMQQERSSETQRQMKLRDAFFKALQERFPGCKLNGGAWDNRHPGNLNVRLPGVDAKSLLNMLQPTVAASTGSACTSGIQESSYVLREIGLSKSEAESSIRFSIGRYTTIADIELAVELICNKACLESAM